MYSEIRFIFFFITLVRTKTTITYVYVLIAIYKYTVEKYLLTNCSEMYAPRRVYWRREKRAGKNKTTGKGKNDRKREKETFMRVKG